MPIQTSYEAWATLTNIEILAAKDPVKLVSRVSIGMSLRQAEFMRMLTLRVKGLTDRIADINDLLKMVNAGIASLAAGNPGDGYDLIGGVSRAAAQKLVDRFIAAGVKLKADGTPEHLIFRSEGGTPETWEVVMQKMNGDALVKSLQNSVSDLTSSNQQEQLTLQTLMGRYNGTIELASNAIKKSELQADAVMTNIKRS